VLIEEGLIKTDNVSESDLSSECVLDSVLSSSDLASITELKVFSFGILFEDKCGSPWWLVTLVGDCSSLGKVSTLSRFSSEVLDDLECLSVSLAPLKHR